MRRPTAIMLILMGGGVALWGASRDLSRGCLDARAQRRPDADAICATSSVGFGHGGGSGYRGGAPGGFSSTLASVVRGGFGAIGHAAAGS